MDEVIKKDLLFSEEIQHSIERLRETNSDTVYRATLSSELIRLCDQLIDAGDQRTLPHPDKPLELSHRDIYLFHYRWLEQAKAYLILWRNVLLEANKADLMLEDGRADLEEVAALKEKSIQTLDQAAADLHQYWQDGPAYLSEQPRGGLRQLEQWHKMTTPWTTYREQLTDLRQQVQELVLENKELLTLQQGLSNIRALVYQDLSDSSRAIEQFEDLAQTTIAFIEEHIEVSAKKVASRLQGLEEENSLPLEHQQFSSYLEQAFHQLPARQRMPMQTLGGIVQYRELQPRRNARQWLDSEVLPLQFEQWEIVQQLQNGLNMSMVNIANRAVLRAQDLRDGRAGSDDLAVFTQPLRSYLSRLEEQRHQLDTLSQQIKSRINDHFYLGAAFDPETTFLPVPLQSTLLQVRLKRLKGWQQLSRWVSDSSLRIRRFLAQVEEEETLSLAEKVVRFVQSRTPDGQSEEYRSIFLTKGYIGESFWVGRTAELQRIEQLIGQWQVGFRGAVLLTGRRMSGRSLFGEVVSNRHFPQDTIRLRPHILMRLAGRTFQTENDLTASLDFVAKYALTRRALIWIDDLELWRTDDHPLQEQLRHLLQFIDDHSSKFFFLVSMTNWLHAHLNVTNGLDRYFQTALNMDRMSQDDIQEAIIIRHGATHKQLVDEDGQPVSARQFRQWKNKVFRQSHGNIGDALNLWALAIQPVSKDKVTYNPVLDVSMPDFVQPDTGILLTAIMLSRRTNDYRLSKLFGPAFGNQYAGLVQRLISMGLLYRRDDNWLTVNERVANAVAARLDQHDYLTY